MICAISGLSLKALRNSGMEASTSPASARSSARVVVATEAELINHKPKLVYLNEDNTVNRTSNTIPMQVA